MLGAGANLSAFEHNQLYLNIEGTEFINASFASGSDIDSDSRSVIPADFDKDGATDLLIASVGGGPLRLFRNQIPIGRNTRVRLELAGSKSNRLGIGARVIFHCGGRQIVRDLFPANGFAGQASDDWLIGLGSSLRIDRMSVRWPSGKTQNYVNLPVNCGIRLYEEHLNYETSDL